MKRKKEVRGVNEQTGRDRDDDRRGDRHGNGGGDKQWVSDGQELIMND